MKLRWKKALVATTVFCSLNFVALSWVQAQARSYATERGLEWGRQLFASASLLEQAGSGELARLGNVQQISINGAQMRLHSGSLSAEVADLSELVQRVKDHCRRPLSGETEVPAVETPILEWVGDDEAFVYCLKPRTVWTREAFTNHFERFAQGGDLSEWGTFQGVYFRRLEGKIRLMSGEISGGLEPSKMFPSKGDARGADLVEVPRPKGRRLFSVNHGKRPSLAIYETEDSWGECLDQYYLSLIEAGLSVQRLDGASPVSSLVARSSDAAFVVTARKTDTGSHLLIARLPD